MLKRTLTFLLSALLLLSPALAMEGMDVSVYQGDIDFQAASKRVQAVYIRSSYGPDGIDSQFISHYEGARAAGLHLGFYHYLEAADPDAARQEARHFASLICDLDYDLRPALDYESFHGLDKASRTAVALAFLETLEQDLGVRPLLYADAYAADDTFGEALAAYPLWVAQWGVSAPDLSGSPWTGYAAWQYTDQGEVLGVAGRVDLDLVGGAAFFDRSAPATYTVRPGDTLWALSLRFHTTVAQLARLNHIADPDLIYVGQVLRLTGSAPGYTTYTVRPGDTLWALSLRFHTTVAQLAHLNHIADPGLIYVGQTLDIPQGLTE